MKIYRKLVIDIETGATLESDYYNYIGPLALANRAAAAAAGKAATTAGQMGGEFQSMGEAALRPATATYEKWLTGEHEVSPDQLNQLLTAVGAGTGGATGAFESKAGLDVARTGNEAGYQAALDEMQRQRGQQLAKGSEGIAAQDVTGAARRQEEGAKGLAGIGQADISDALSAMGLQTKDINTEIEANKSGWMQNLTGMMSALQGAGKGSWKF
jgi:hypothetical protein